MSKIPTVSGIIIFLNAERFLEEAIQSVLAQTLDDWELLLVDDGSTDASTAIARRYAIAHPEKIHYLEHEGHENRGMSAARNLGIRHARGKYIAFVDSDDVWEPNKLQDQVALLAAHPEAAMLYGRTRWWYSWTGKPEDAERDHFNDLIIAADRVIPPPALLERILQYNHDLPCTCSVLIRRDIINQLGGFEEEFRNQYEDMILYVKLFLEHPVYVSTDCWDRYRQHPDNSCAIALKAGIVHPEKPNPATRVYFAWVAEYLQNKGFKGSLAWKIVADQRWPYVHPILYWLSKLPQRIRMAIGLRTRLRALRTALGQRGSAASAQRS